MWINTKKNEIKEPIMPQIEDLQNWKQFLKNIEQELPSLTFNSWFAPIKPRYFGKGTIKASVPNPFFIEWIEERYSHLIKRCLSNSFGEGYNLVLFVDEEYENSNQNLSDDFNLAIEFEPDSKPLNSFLPNNNTSKNLVEKKDNIQNNDFILNGSFAKENQTNLSLNSKEGFDPKLKAKYTFENFVVGEGNQLARAAAYAVAERPGETTFNPLLFMAG